MARKLRSPGNGTSRIARGLEFVGEGNEFRSFHKRNLINRGVTPLRNSLYCISATQVRIAPNALFGRRAA